MPSSSASRRELEKRVQVGARADAGAAAAASSAGPLRVLVVDDDRAVRRTLVRLLTRRGLAVVGEGASVEQAVALAARLAPDVVLLDVELPDGLGTDAAARIAANRRAHSSDSPAFVLCTGNPGRVPRAEMARAGAFAVLEKPIATDALIDVLRAAVEHSAPPRGAIRGTGTARDNEHPGDDVTDEHLVALLRHLRSTLRSYVDVRRRAGVSAAQVIGEVRCLVREAESCEPIDDPSDSLLRRTVQWAAAAYDDRRATEHATDTQTSAG